MDEAPAVLKKPKVTHPDVGEATGPPDSAGGFHDLVANVIRLQASGGIDSNTAMVMLRAIQAGSLDPSANQRLDGKRFTTPSQGTASASKL